MAKADEPVDMDRIKAFAAEIDEHLAAIEKLEQEAKQSGEDLSDAFKGE